MEILLSNDDGIDSPGLKVLQEKFSRLGKVTVVAPFQEQSGSSHSLTLFQPIFLHQTRCNFLKSPMWVLNGTPVDCIKLALGKLLKQKPAFIVVGINYGANVGIDIFYSGTVAAAREGSLWGIPSFAVSLEKSPKRVPDFRTAGKAAFNLIKSLTSYSLPRDIVFNINIPAHNIKGVKYTRQDLSFTPEKFIKGIDPRGRTYYWMEAGRAVLLKKPSKSTDPLMPPSDIDALREGYISITPLKLDQTNFLIIPSLPKVLKF